jgi:quercetin dioxygenase-like cupin family protein
MAVKRIPKDEVPIDRSAIEGQGFAATFASFDAPEREDTWHHHGEHDIIAFLLDGAIAVETPGDGTVDLRAGDLVHIERGTVHREIYRGHIEMVGFNVGDGPGRVEVPSDDA